MRLVVGLGNPGTRYAKTRHNVGFMFLDTLCERWELKANLGGSICKQGSVFYLKPQTFMNISGAAVQAVAHYYKIPPSAIVAIYDDKDIAFGNVRFRQNGSSGGHNGMKSIITCLGTEAIARIKIGVAPADTAGLIDDTANYVLSKFSTTELAHLPAIFESVQSRLTNWLK